MTSRSLSLVCRYSQMDLGRYQCLGMASVIINSLSPRGVDVGSLLVSEVLPAYRHSKIIFLFEAELIPVGFVTWAQLSKETEARILDSLDPWLHISEWAEGQSLWIRQCWLPARYFGEAIRLILNSMTFDSRVARHLSVRKGKVCVYEYDRIFLERLAGFLTRRNLTY